MVAQLLLMHSVDLLLFFLPQISVAGAPSPHARLAGAGFGYQRVPQDPSAPNPYQARNN